MNISNGNYFPVNSQASMTFEISKFTQLNFVEMVDTFLSVISFSLGICKGSNFLCVAVSLLDED